MLFFFFFTDLHSLILWLSRALYLLRVSYKKRFITIYLFLKLDLSAIQPLNPCHPHGSAQLKPGEPWLFQINLMYCMEMLIDIRRMPRSRGSKLNTSAFSWWSQSPFEKRESLLQFFLTDSLKGFELKSEATLTRSEVVVCSDEVMNLQDWFIALAKLSSKEYWFPPNIRTTPAKFLDDVSYI